MAFPIFESGSIKNKEKTFYAETLKFNLLSFESLVFLGRLYFRPPLWENTLQNSAIVYFE